MPVFHTKTIEEILEPVANQVSQLVILHEEGEDGAAIKSLLQPITVVKGAVTNLAMVGRQQVESTKDEVLRIDTPPAINKVENSADLLMKAATNLGDDPYSKIGRENLIAGARGILQGTSDLLLVFDEAEVRRICHMCQNVRDYLKVCEVVQGREDLVTYIKNLSPGMTNMSKMVIVRAKDLTNATHANKLNLEIDGLKTQLANLISSMKAYVAMVKDGSPSGQEAAAANRQFYAQNIASVITEIIRLLQLVSTDQEFDFDRESTLGVKQIKANLAKNMSAAKNWLNDPNAQAGSPDEIALREILDTARDIGNRSGDALGKKIAQKCNKIGKMADQLAELRRQGKGNSAEAKRIAADIQSELDSLLRDVDQALNNITTLDDACETIASKTPAAKEWLADVKAKPGPGTGSEALRDITGATRQAARILGQRPHTATVARDLLKLCDEIDQMVGDLDKYREQDKGHDPEARMLAKQLTEKLGQVNTKVFKAVARDNTPQTLEAKMNDALKWLDDLKIPDDGAGALAAHGVISDARKLAREAVDPRQKALLLAKAAECEAMLHELEELVQQGKGDSPQARALAQKLKANLAELKDMMKDALVSQVADEFSDTTTVLKQFAAAASAAKNVPNRQENFDDKALKLNQQATRIADLATQAVAASSLCSQDKIDNVRHAAKKIKGLTPQVINAGKIVFENPDNKEAQDHFKTLRDEWLEKVDELTEQVDNSMDIDKFVKASEEGIRREHETCVNAMKTEQPMAALNSAGNIARRAHRVLMAGKREIENTDDDQYVRQVDGNLKELSSTINPLVQATRQYATDHKNCAAQNNVIEKDEKLIEAVTSLRTTLCAKKMEEEARNVQIQEPPPPLPPLPVDTQEAPPARPPLPEEEEFPEDEGDSQNPLMMQAARELHEEAKKWESKGNDIISAAKRMAVLMAKMSRLVKGEGGKKSDLISCAKEIAKASNEVTRLAREVAEKCTDKRIRTDMMKTCDRIPTIGTQLRILSTVKAASLGDFSEMSKEEEAAAEQATEMLVHNAQNLMMSVKDTVKYAEAASIRIRTDTGLRMRWVRK